MPIIDPRLGDAEDDASSTKKRSLLAIAGSLLVEISIPKLVIAWLALIALPGILLGLAPLVATAWLATFLVRITAYVGVGSLLLLALVTATGWYGFRPVLRLVEQSFWSLNSIAVQPGYALVREVLRHQTERVLSSSVTEARRVRLRAGMAAAAGAITCGVAIGIVALAWPHTRWSAEASDLARPLHLIVPALANAVVLVGVFLAAASLLWGIADATMDQPQSLDAFDEGAASSRTWRVAHLSDIHVVGEPYGFRIESGRAGPRGNDRLERVLERLDALHRAQPLDYILITGDMTDAGRSSEWAVFLDLLARHPAIAERTFILPGNHDLNIIDRSQPARLDLPTSPGKRLRQMRALSAMEAVQGGRVHVFDQATGAIGPTLSEALAPHRQAMAAFADDGSLRRSLGLGRIWEGSFPMLCPPAEEDGIGLVLVNSNAETHFSFTNALGLLVADEARAVLKVLQQFPRARWVLALHHHLVEYPQPAKALSERIGTALINGNWALRKFQPVAHRLVAMHGHRHVDWIGRCGRLRIISAPSPVMEATDGEPTAFYIHTLGRAAGGGIALMEPQRIRISGS